MPFCLMWANENWSRRWDGSDNDILIAQDYRPEDDADLVDCLARHMADRRYIRIGSRPLLMIYRPGTIPDPVTSIGRWRNLFRERHGEDPIFIMGQAFKDNDPRAFGMDGAIEFPPHKLLDSSPLINERLHVLDDDFTAQVYDYGEAVDQALAAPTPDFPLIRTAAPSWDNDARRQGHGLVLHGSTPPLYERWLAGLVERARRAPFFGEPIVCINAWNEWAEGAYLEPDQHFGAAYLNATARASTGFEHARRNGRLLLVGHDAFPAGAQALLLAIGRQLKAQHGVDILFVLLDDGAMIERYRAVAPTEILTAGKVATRQRLQALRQDGYTSALVNSAASTPFAADLHAAGIDFTLLQHELPNLLRQRNLQASLAHACQLARDVIVPAASLIDPRIPVTPTILPQGLYTPAVFSPSSRDAKRAGLGLGTRDRLIVGAGYADMRKGFDLFLQLWQRLHVSGATGARNVGATHFLWIGDIDPSLREGLDPDISLAISLGTFHMPGHCPDITPYLCAADAFALTSREDPYPSVVLEALATGLPCSTFARSGGIPQLLQLILTEGDAGHAVVPQGDLSAMARAIMTAARISASRASSERRLIGRRHADRFSFPAYVETLHQYLAPKTPRLSIVVLSYNYARYLAGRLASIFTQHVPVLEIIVLDDASTDDSVAVARQVSKEWQRTIRIVAGRHNSGSVFSQWRRAVERARGDWIWIAEADDLSEPSHMATLLAALEQAPTAVMAFCDSRSINEDGAPVSSSYKPYYAESVGSRLERDSLHKGRAFVRECLGERNLIMNVSSAIFARKPLRAALARCQDELAELKVAGDWRLYVELLDQPRADVVYVADTLNIHRRHASSATHSLALERHLAEIVRIQDVIAARFGQEDDLRMRQHAYRRALIRQFGLGPRSIAAE